MIDTANPGASAMPDPTDPTDPNATPTTDPTPTPIPAPLPDPSIALTDEIAAKAALDAALSQQAQVNTVVAGATTTEAGKRAVLGQVVAAKGSITYTTDGQTATTLLPNGDGTYHPVAGTFLDLRTPPAPAPTPAPEPPPAS